MAEKNVFAELQEENEKNYAQVHTQIKKNIQGRKGIWTLIGDIIELYVPQIFTTVGRTINASSGLLSSGDNADKMKSIE